MEHLESTSTGLGTWNRLSGFHRGGRDSEDFLGAPQPRPRQESDRSQTFRLAHRLRCARGAPGEFRQGAPRGCRGWQATESPDSKAFLKELVEASFPHSVFARVLGRGGNTESPAFWVLVV